MSRKIFLTIVACISLPIGAVALIAPGALLAGKGVAPVASTEIWVREVGILIVGLGTMCLVVRGHVDSPTMRAFLGGNALLHAGLLPIEFVAWSNGSITHLSGIVPNSILHLVFALAFLLYARRCFVRPAATLWARGTELGTGGSGPISSGGRPASDGTGGGDGPTGECPVARAGRRCP